MLTKLKEMFRGGTARKGGARASRVNLAKRFLILEENSSQGSMSKVYKAVDNDSGKTVCLKVQDAEKNDAAAARCGHAGRPCEGEVASRVVHPAVVRTFDHGLTTKNEQFLVMEYISGQSLQYVRETRVYRHWRDRVEVLARAAEGLAAVHQAGFLHHDVNPRNYMVTREGRVKLIDFGLAVPNTPEFRRPGNRTGALAYMAPELVRREPIDERLDVFAFGALAFEFLTDKLPYDATSSMSSMLQRINAEPLDPAHADPTLPKELHELLRKLTARRKDDRWPQMATVAAALRATAVKRR